MTLGLKYILTQTQTYVCMYMFVCICVCVFIYISERYEDNSIKIRVVRREDRLDDMGK